jgi:hypothetical protein
MARGSPDWTQSIDNSHTHYEYYRPTTGTLLIPPLNKYQLIDLDMTGIFGWCFMVVDNPNSLLRVEIDSREIFELDCDDAFNNQGLYKGGLDSEVGVSLYNAVDNHYGLWFHSRWQEYFYKHLMIEIDNITIFNCNVTIVQGMYGKYTG